MLALVALAVCALAGRQFVREARSDSDARGGGGTLEAVSSMRGEQASGTPAPTSRPVASPAADRAASVLRGRVVDRGGIPVNHAEVRVFLHVPNDQTVYATADSFDVRRPVDADAHFAVLVPRHGKFFVMAVAKGFASAARDWVNPGEDCELVVDVPAVISGCVLHKDSSRPLAGAKIRLWLDGSPTGPVQECTSDAEGAYRFSDLGAGRVYLWTWLEGFVHQGDDVMLEPGLAASHDVRLDPGLQISGRVVAAETGRPIAGAHVGGPERLVRTDAQGGFTMGGLTPGYYDLGAWLNGWLPGQLSVVVNAGRVPDDLVFALRPARTVSGVVIDEAGHPLDHASVRTWSESVATGPDGRFSVTSGVDKGHESDKWITANCPGYTPAVIVDAEGVSGDVTFRLEPADVTVSGRVRTLDGAPIAGARVTCHPSPQGATGTDDAGAFVFERCERRTSFQVRAIAAGFAEASCETKPPEGERTTSLEVTLGPTAGELRVSGVVVDESGGGIEGALVALQSRDWERLGSARTAPDGTFEAGVRQRNNRPVSASVTADGFLPEGAWLDARALTPVRIVLRRSGQIRGRVVDSATGDPVRQASIRLQPGPDLPASQYWGGTGQTADFAFGAAPGTYWIVAESAEHLASAPMRIDVVAGSSTDAGTIALVRAGAIEGVIRSASGSAERLGVVVASPERGACRWPAWTDSTGWFHIDGLALGTWEVFGVDEKSPHWRADDKPVFLCSMGSVEVSGQVVARIDGRMLTPATLSVAAMAEPEPGADVVGGAPWITSKLDFLAANVPDPETGSGYFDLTVESLTGIPIAVSDNGWRFSSTIAGRWWGKGLRSEVSLSTLPAGSYKLTLKGAGRESVETTVRLDSGQRRRISLELPRPGR